MADAPPRLLALASATTTLSVALLEGIAAPRANPILRAELIERDVRAHGERLLPSIARLLEACGWERASLSDIAPRDGAHRARSASHRRSIAQRDAAHLAGIALAIGPGTFTGLRVALATAKALAFGGTPPVFPVSTLAALAATAGHARRNQNVAALLDARRGELYAGVFSHAGATRAEVLREDVYTPEQLARALPRGALLVAGEGASPAADALCAARADLQRTRGECELRAATVGKLAWSDFIAGRGQNARDVAPVYLQRAAAERA